MFLALITFLCTIKFSHQLYKYDPNIFNLNAQDFEKKITNSSKVWIVEFYSPRCRHCINFVPEFKNLSSQAKTEFPVGAVDCLAEKRICFDYKIHSFPTIAFMFKTYIIDHVQQFSSNEILNAARNAAKDFSELSVAQKLSTGFK